MFAASIFKYCLQFISAYRAETIFCFAKIYMFIPVLFIVHKDIKKRHMLSPGNFGPM